MKSNRSESQPAVESPYLTARREWNERYGDYIKTAHQWRLAAFGSIAIALASVSGLIAVSMQTKVVPYVVQLNGHNEVVRVQRADVLNKPNANQIRAALRTWIIGARTIYTDPVAMRSLIDQTYAETLPDSPANRALDEYKRANNPYQLAATKTVNVDVQVVMPVSENTWQVEWLETTRSGAGKLVSSEAWQATMTIVISPPNSEEQIMLNPLGVYVRQFSWTKRLQHQ